ncbi:tRNA (adenosine(37)-N6)-threonylcarbamoyltransferase complex dimerization subunit type 1 TsaB [Porphyromonas sp.]|uniref:tRNA (adenosine(37)-N6)-threonylcarbamoyltransferase complex dimerization subunit type 1 TsaB n=1 Tax=Porphyromonas sp. TaxID=1924944 RepID=UPI0026DD79C2|nr:tRNA (adenosine(37)-N6)-threonylcarbamoyltransferase complex dimerization subunit type 1 TsaB [Porphyromonas sp.]MDO4771114.1 tRNA (adenosine(37)-N6)-threonylcarbamoyltransferase complex dimerization subunit type 1 TsaB [Porphyromonas sp.]
MASTQDYYLLIDTSTDVCSVALASEQAVIAQEIEKGGNRHSALIGDFVSKVLKAMPAEGNLKAVVLAEGPGSYTGLRIAAAFAKAFCMIRQIPLIAVPTPEVMVYRYLALHPDKAMEDVLLMPMIDARRMEVYTALYDCHGEKLSDIKALIIEEAGLATIAPQMQDKTLLYFGDGAAKGQEIMSRLFPKSHYVDGIIPEAQALLKPMLLRLAKGETCDIAYWTPFYLKEYEAKMSVNKVLGNHRTE